MNPDNAAFFQAAFSQTPFFQVPRTRTRVSAGEVQLPILYYDASALYAFFLVEQEKIRHVLLDAELDPGMRLGSKAVVGLACYQYRNTSVGVYNEVGLAVAVTRQGDRLAMGGWRDVLASFTHPEERRSGLYVLDLPVTTPIANAAGREIWGFPKFVAPIDFELDEGHFACSVHPAENASEQHPEKSAPLMTLAGKMGLSMPTLPFSLALYSYLNQKLQRSTVNVRGRTHLALPGSVRLQIGSGQHVMVQHLQQLGLQNAKPVALMWTDCFQSRLNAGVPVTEECVPQRGVTSISRSS